MLYSLNMRTWDIIFISIIFLFCTPATSKYVENITCNSNLSIKIGKKVHRPPKLGQSFKVQMFENTHTFFEIISPDGNTLKIYPWGGIHWKLDQKNFKVFSNNHSWIRVENKGVVDCQK